jgi:hypothetical protein
MGTVTWLMFIALVALLGLLGCFIAQAYLQYRLDQAMRELDRFDRHPGY